MIGPRPPTSPVLILFIFAAALAWIVVAGGSHGLAQSASVIVAIVTMEEGVPPPEFDFARTGQGKTGQWRVVADPTATGGRAIEQSDADRTDYRFPLAIHRSFSAKNVQASVRFKAVAGKVDQAGGLAVRVLDSENYYVVRANAMEDNVRFYRVVKGKRQELAGANLRVVGNQWHTLGLNAEDDTFTVLFNGKVLYSTTDRTFTESGKVALWTKADSITRFDQIELKALP